MGTFGIDEPYVAIDGIPVDLDAIPPKSITIEQYSKVQANTAGFQRLYTLMNDECFVLAAEYILKNCSPRFPGTYDWALVHTVVPELLKRFREGQAGAEALEGRVYLPKDIPPGRYQLKVDGNGSFELRLL